MQHEYEELGAWYWWACEEPERPTDPYILWHFHGCPGCIERAALIEVSDDKLTHTEEKILRYVQKKG